MYQMSNQNTFYRFISCFRIKNIFIDRQTIMLKNVNIIVILSEEFQAQIIKSQSSISKPFSYNESLHLAKL